MNNSLIIWFKNLAEGWKIFLALTGMISFVAIAAVKIDHWKDKGLNQENVISYLKQADIDRIKQERVKDSLDIIKWKELYTRLKGMSDTSKFIYNNQDKIVGSIDMVAIKVAGSIAEYKKFVSGLQFELVQSDIMKSVFPETKIKIIKIDTTKKK